MFSLTKRILLLTLPLIFATVIALRLKTPPAVVLDTVPIKDTKVLSRALYFIRGNYFDPETINPPLMLKKATQKLESGVAPLLVREKDRGLEIRMGEKKAMIPLPHPLTIDEIPPALGRLLGFLDLFYQGRLDDEERLSLAMSGIADTLDPHSNYLPTKIYNEFKIGTKGNFGGLGIVIGIRDSELTVISPLEGTPAYQAGIRAKDKIIQIGEESTINLGLTEAVEKLRGPIGSKVTIIVNRAGVGSPMKFTLTRALIHIQSVAGRLLNGTGQKKFALVKVKNFQEDTLEQFKKILNGFKAGGATVDGIILDLRNNPGGLLDQAVALGDYFLKSGVIVKTIGPHGEPIETEEAEEGQAGEKLPIVVIINEGSASASEIVSGALQFNDRAVVIGNRSFGKGSVQTVYDLKDGSALKLTIAQYLTADDQPVQSIGINPDINLIPATIQETEKGEKRVDLFEDIKRREQELVEESHKDENREDGLKPDHLQSSLFQMTYLSPESGEKEEEESSQIEVKDDFPVQLARRILEQHESQTLDRKEMLKTIPPLLEDFGQEEEKKIADQLSKIGVDWSQGEETEKPSGEVNIELFNDKNQPVEGLAPGESGFLKITIENQGNAPYLKLAAVTESEDPMFANLEFPFGRINPQEKKTWKTPLKILDFAHRRSVPVNLVYHEAFGRFPKSPPFHLQVKEPPLPVFSYHYTLLDDGKEGTVGNGNHQAEPGETIGLVVHLKNIGRGTSTAPVINLKSVDGQESFIEKGRIELKPLGPGEEIEAILRFRLQKDGHADQISFDLIIIDNHLGEELTDKLVITLKTGTSDPLVGILQQPPLIEIPPESLPLVVSGSSYTIKGKVSDDHEVRHLFLMVGDEKVSYQSPSTVSQGDNKSHHLDLTAPLKKGLNFITLVAQDDRELTTRKQWVVWREK